METERLLLREITLGDAPFMLDVLNDPGFLENVGDRQIRTLSDAEQYITDRIRASYEQYRFGFYKMVAKESGEEVGICGLVKREYLELPDVGFAVLERFCGRGYAGEAAKAVLQYASDVLGLTRIAGVTRPDNATSRHLLEKLGLRYERMTPVPNSEHEWMVFTQA